MVRHAIRSCAKLAYKDEYSDYSRKRKWCAVDPDSVVEPRLAKRGFASAAVTPPTTLPQLLRDAATKHGSSPALRVEWPVPEMTKTAEGKDSVPPALPLDEWTTWTWCQYYDEVCLAAKGMISLGFERFDSVNIWGFNSPWWMMAAMSAGFAGGKVAGLYPTDSVDTAAYKVVHSCGSIIVVEDEAKIDKLVTGLNERGDASHIKAIVAWGFEPSYDIKRIKGCGRVPVLTWQALIDKGAAEDDREINRRVDGVKPGHCAAIIYTSGTTGEPKAVMISHDNIYFEAANVMAMLDESVGYGSSGKEERVVSYLPLSHVAGMMVDIISPICLTASTNYYTSAFFVRPYDLKAGTLKDRLCIARPTIFLGVPLVWEKIADKMRALGASVTGLKKKIATWAKAKGLEHSRNCLLGGSGARPWGYSVANAVVFKKAKAALGLDQCKYGFTGAAPIRKDTLEYFGSVGIQINEIYGMSECSGACTFSCDECHEWGSCGSEMPGVEVKVFLVDEVDINKKTECPRAPNLDCVEEKYQGEICFRGRNIMMGYMACPDMGEEHRIEIEKKTSETVDSEGWLHSGDKGMITEKGMVKITGRYKELIIGDGGENIAPVPIEDHIKKMCDGIAEVMMVGDKRKYNIALVTLKVVQETTKLDAGAKAVNPDITTCEAAIKDSLWIKTVTDAISSANSNPKVCANPSFRISKFTIIPGEFSEEAGLLTPTKKLKRKSVEKYYEEHIEAMYAEKDTKKVYIPYGGP